MKCPIDGEKLEVGKAEAHVGYGCSSCGGSWLPKKYVDSIKYETKFEPEKFWAQLKNRSNHVTQTKCPSNCDSLYKVDDLDGIKYCQICSGVWFEPGVLKTLHKEHSHWYKTEEAFIGGRIALILANMFS